MNADLNVLISLAEHNIFSFFFFNISIMIVILKRGTLYINYILIIHVQIDVVNATKSMQSVILPSRFMVYIRFISQFTWQSNVNNVQFLLS